MPIPGINHPFTEAKILAVAPRSHGVYALWRGSELTYYGRAAGMNVTIESRLLSHLRGYEGPCTMAATAFQFESHSRPEQRERALLLEHQRAYGRLPRCNDRVG